jgi:hypothetical protein
MGKDSEINLVEHPDTWLDIQKEVLLVDSTTVHLLSDLLKT